MDKEEKVTNNNGNCETAIELEISKQIVEFNNYFELQIFSKVFAPNILTRVLSKAYQEAKDYKQLLSNILTYVQQWVEDEKQKDFSDKYEVVKNLMEPILQKFKESMDDLKKLMKQEEQGVSSEAIETFKNRNMSTFKAWVDQVSASVK